MKAERLIRWLLGLTSSSVGIGKCPNLGVCTTFPIKDSVVGIHMQGKKIQEQTIAGGNEL